MCLITQEQREALRINVVGVCVGMTAQDEELERLIKMTGGSPVGSSGIQAESGQESSKKSMAICTSVKAENVEDLAEWVQYYRCLCSALFTASVDSYCPCPLRVACASFSVSFCVQLCVYEILESAADQWIDS
jgi:hypothetical protein